MTGHELIEQLTQLTGAELYRQVYIPGGHFISPATGIDLTEVYAPTGDVPVILVKRA